VAAGRRERLEQVCRYLRPPVSAERLQVTDTGHVRLTFKHPWLDGTTAVVFDPVTFALITQAAAVERILRHLGEPRRDSSPTPA